MRVCVIMTVEAPDRTPVDEIIEHFVIQQGWTVLEDFVDNEEFDELIDEDRHG